MASPTVVCVGLATLDVIAYVDAPPEANTKVQAVDSLVTAGGPATNAAITSALLGTATSLVTLLGDGPLASVVRRDVTAAGVTAVDLAPTDSDVAVSAVTVTLSTGDRSVVSANGAGRSPVSFDADHLIREASLLLIDGHYPDLCLPAAHAAHALGIPVVLDGGSWKDITPDLAPLLTVAAVSERFRVPTGDDAARWLLDHGVSHAVVTSGAGPVRWSTPHHDRWLDVPQVTTVDTLGAGDVFHGALCATLARQEIDSAAMEAALRTAIDVAARSVQHRGPRSWAQEDANRNVSR